MEIQAVRRGTRGGVLSSSSDPVHGRGSARIGAIVLAAGGSTRMGSQKLLLEGKSGESLLRETLHKVIDLDLNDLVLVEGAERKVGETARELGARTVINDGWREGIASSIRLAVESLGDDLDAALILLADQPSITRGDLESLLHRWRTGKRPVAAASYPQGGGVPAIFDRSLFDELLRLEGDRGARELIRSLDEVDLVEMADTRDVDDPESYRQVVRADDDSQS